MLENPSRSSLDRRRGDLDSAPGPEARRTTARGRRDIGAPILARGGSLVPHNAPTDRRETPHRQLLTQNFEFPQKRQSLDGVHSRRDPGDSALVVLFFLRSRFDRLRKRTACDPCSRPPRTAAPLVTPGAHDALERDIERLPRQSSDRFEPHLPFAQRGLAAGGLHTKTLTWHLTEWTGHKQEENGWFIVLFLTSAPARFGGEPPRFYVNFAQSPRPDRGLSHSSPAQSIFDTAGDAPASRTIAAWTQMTAGMLPQQPAADLCRHESALYALSMMLLLATP